MAAFMSFPSSRECVLTSGDTTIGVIPELCLVSHFQVGPWSVLYRPEETGNVRRWGIPLMIPNFGRLKEGIFKEKNTMLPIHGFGRHLPWTIVEQTASSMVMELKSNDATRPNYPYEFIWTATIAAGEGTLTYTLIMENCGDEAMPIAPGFHPYFALDQQDKARLTVDALAGFEAGAFQWDTQPPDNAYPFDRQVTIEFPHRGRLTITELPDEGNYSLKEMQVWSEPVLVPDHAFVCFEPIVTREDGLNRPEDRLNISPHRQHRIILQLAGSPL